MHIHGPAQVHGAQNVNAPHSQRPVQSGQAPTPLGTDDQLELSEAGQLAARLAEIPDIRQDRVAELRDAIADGRYETDEKLSVALDRLLEEIG